MPKSIAERLTITLGRIHQAARSAARDPADVRLLAVSKRQSAESIRQAWRAGQRDFGENYVQEGVSKAAELADCEGICWHFIGPVQSNKTRALANTFDWVHTVDRLKIAQRLSAQRPADRPPLQVCLQVNIEHSEVKAGAAPEDIPALASAVHALPNLVLRGLMCIPDATDEAGAREAFAAMARLFTQCTPTGDQQPAGATLWDTLSMGMSADLEWAIGEGSTLVRAGTAIFGSRT